MTLLDDMKTALRVKTDAFDPEVQMLVGAALGDMERVGVNPALLEIVDEDLENPLVKTAVFAYCKAGFGYDNPEATRFDGSYRRIVCDLLNSSENIAAMEQEEPDPEPSDEEAPDEGPGDGEGDEG